MSPSRSWTAVPAFASGNTRFLWSELRVTTEARPHNDPEAPTAAFVTLRTGTRTGRRFFDQRATGKPRLTCRLRRVGESGAPPAGVGTACCRTSRRSSATSISMARCMASEGRIPVRRVFPDNWSDYARATADAFKMAGYRYVPDQNGEFRGRLLSAGDVESLRPAGLGRGRLSGTDRPPTRQSDGH